MVRKALVEAKEVVHCEETVIWTECFQHAMAGIF